MPSLQDRHVEDLSAVMFNMRWTGSRGFPASLLFFEGSSLSSPAFFPQMSQVVRLTRLHGTHRTCHIPSCEARAPSRVFLRLARMQIRTLPVQLSSMLLSLWPIAGCGLVPRSVEEVFGPYAHGSEIILSQFRAGCLVLVSLQALRSALQKLRGAQLPAAFAFRLLLFPAFCLKAQQGRGMWDCHVVPRLGPKLCSALCGLRGRTSEIITQSPAASIVWLGKGRGRHFMAL